MKNPHLQSRGAESGNARVCSDHFVTGRPSDATDVDSQDWAPSINLRYLRETPQTEASRQPEERARAREVHCTGEHTETEKSQDLDREAERFQDAVCQTELTMEDITRQVDAFNGYISEICSLKKKVLDTEFTEETFQNNDKTRLYTGLPNF